MLFLRHNSNNIKKDPKIRSNLDFYIEDEILHIKGKPEVGVTLLNGEPYIISENYKGPIDKFDKSNLDRNYILLLFTLREITSDPKKKVKSSIYRGFNTKNRGACEFWDTYWVFQFGISESTAEEGLDLLYFGRHSVKIYISS